MVESAGLSGVAGNARVSGLTSPALRQLLVMAYECMQREYVAEECALRKAGIVRLVSSAQSYGWANAAAICSRFQQRGVGARAAAVLGGWLRRHWRRRRLPAGEGRRRGGEGGHRVGDINILIEFNINIEVPIIINVNIENILCIICYLFPVGYCLLLTPYCYCQHTA